jgi:hypothetical protein
MSRNLLAKFALAGATSTCLYFALRALRGDSLNRTKSKDEPSTGKLEQGNSGMLLYVIAQIHSFKPRERLS